MTSEEELGDLPVVREIWNVILNHLPIVILCEECQVLVDIHLKERKEIQTNEKINLTVFE